MTPSSGRGELLAPRASVTRLVVALLLAALGFAAVTQVRATSSDSAYAGARRQDLVLLLDSLDAATARTQAEIAELERSRQTLQNDSSGQRAALAQAREQLAALAILTGTVPAVGPGISITISDPTDAIGASTLLNAIEELRNAGAEAIELNGAVRVVASTALVDTPRGLVVGGRLVQPPYVLAAIGAPHTLSEAVVFPGGLTDEVAALGGSARVSEVDELRIDSLHALQPPQYASPTSAGGD
ncbi:MAG TPA: DUF881 domain-containing protein [Nocardioidaceae bacterium]|jgi:uncharacterized protein YlxW (UPF0749 family)|nr:DUF881 domain-containing protein [Nocardioidaceae bacterium]